jgi:hypothetical protein
MRSWHLYSEITPNLLGSNKKVWWICTQGHEWQARVTDRNYRKTGCPYCSGYRVCVDNCLYTINPNLARQWHPTKNGPLNPKEVTPGSSKKVWWICSEGHTWEAVVSNRNSGTGCPYCAGRALGADNCLQTLNPSLAAEWHPVENGRLTPRDVTPGSSLWEVSLLQRYEETTMSSSLSESPIFEYYLRKVMDKIEGPPFGSYLITRIRMTVTASKNALMLAVLCILLASTYGCTACIVGSTATVGASGAEAGVTRFEMGRVTRFEIAQYKDVIEASRLAAENLALELKEEKIEENRASFRYLDDKDQRIDLLIERRTDTVTSIKIDVGIFGPPGLGLLTLNQILNELAEHET